MMCLPLRGSVLPRRREDAVRRRHAKVNVALRLLSRRLADLEVRVDRARRDGNLVFYHNHKFRVFDLRLTYAALVKYKRSLDAEFTILPC